MSMTENIAQAALEAAMKANRAIAPYDFCDAESRQLYTLNLIKKWTILYIPLQWRVCNRSIGFGRSK
ncbi:hypothetical protein C0Q44_27065 [Paenibacillus sp. PCH8]|nr:hypothetical protein C0Q44_27065 [Paenibacillus sp. PCH8]